MIKGLNISKKYKKFALQPTSIEIDKGEIVALIGENGAGKSTLIKCMCGVIDADEGQLEVDDQVVKKLDDVLVLGFMNQDQNVYNEIKIRDLTNFVKDVMKKKFDQEVYYYYFKDVFQLDDDYKMKDKSYSFTPEKLTRKKKVERFTGIIFAHSDIDDPGNFVDFLEKNKNKTKNLNGIRSAITKSYGETDGLKYYSLFKPYFKIISALK